MEWLKIWADVFYFIKEFLTLVEFVKPSIKKDWLLVIVQKISFKFGLKILKENLRGDKLCLDLETIEIT